MNYLKLVFFFLFSFVSHSIACEYQSENNEAINICEQLSQCGQISKKYLEERALPQRSLYRVMTAFGASCTGFSFSTWNYCVNCDSQFLLGVVGLSTLAYSVLIGTNNPEYNKLHLLNLALNYKTNPEDNRLLSNYIDTFKSRNPRVYIDIDMLAEKIILANNAGYFVPVDAFKAKEFLSSYSSCKDIPNVNEILPQNFVIFEKMTEIQIIEQIFKKNLEQDLCVFENSISCYLKEIADYLEKAQPNEQTPLFGMPIT